MEQNQTTTQDNSINYEKVSNEEALAAGSPAEQPKISQEQLDAHYAAPVIPEKAPEVENQTQQLLESLQTEPVKVVERAVSVETAVAQQESSITPAEFMKAWGGEDMVNGYASKNPSDVGAAQFLEGRRLDVGEKFAIVGLGGGAAALTYLGLPILIEAGGISAILASAGIATTVIGVGVPVLAAGTALYLGGKGLRNFLAERSFKKAFGRSVDQLVKA